MAEEKEEKNGTGIISASNRISIKNRPPIAKEATTD